jgi:hypothetical protein
MELLAVVNNDREELLQVIECDKGVRGKPKQKEGEESARQRLPPEAGEVATFSLNFNGGNVPLTFGFGQGVEGGQGGHCAVRLEVSRERRGG